MVNAVKPLMGILKGVTPFAAAPSLQPGAVLPAFGSILSNVVDLLKGLFAGSAPTEQNVDISKDLGFSSSAQDLALNPDGMAREKGVPIRDFNVPEEELHADLRQEIERQLAEIPYEEMSVQVDAVRQLLSKLDTKSMSELPQDAAPGPVIRDLVQILQQWKEQGGWNQENPAAASAPMPTSQNVLEEAAPETPFVSALERAPKVPSAPPAPEIEVPKADAAAPKVPNPSEVASIRVPKFVPPAAPAPTPEAPPPTEAPRVSVAEATPAPAPAAPAAMPAYSAAIVESRTEGTPARTDGAVRNAVSADSRRSEMFNSAARVAQSQTAAPDTDRVEFVERLMRAARMTQLKGQTRLKMVLNPPNLGSLKVDLAMKEHVLNGTLRTETAAARDMILSQMQSLRDQLENQGIHVGSFDVNVDAGSGQARQQDLEGSNHARNASASRPMERPETPASESLGQRIRSSQLQMIDVMA